MFYILKHIIYKNKKTLFKFWKNKKIKLYINKNNMIILEKIKLICN